MDDNPDWGTCVLGNAKTNGEPYVMEYPESKMRAGFWDRWGWVETKSDFGCRQFKGKDSDSDAVKS